MIGRTIAQYRILETLGSGGMGVVYKAEDTRLKRHVALKFLTTMIPTEAAERKRFLREAQAASAINHPNVCIMYAIEEVQGEEFLVMEYIEGVTLRKWTALETAKSHTARMTVEETITLVLQVAQGLEAAHRKGIVHRDIKPENIMVTNDGWAKIKDFGIAKLMGETRMTRTGSTIGTVAYMSPEQVQGGAIDQQADVYAFGVVLYELISGTLPFHADQIVMLMFAIVHYEPKPLGEACQGVDPALEQIVMKCIAKKKNDRYTSMRDVIADLKGFKDRTKTVLAPAERIPVSRGQVGNREAKRVPWRKQRNVLWASLALAAIAAVAAFLILRTSTTGEARLTIATVPSGSKVWVNGIEAGVTPLQSYRVSAGRIAVHLALNSYAPADTSFELGVDQSAQLRIPLGPIAQGRADSQSVGGGAAAPAAIGSVNDLATSLLQQIQESAASGNDPVVIRPFTLGDTQFGSGFSRYFQSLLRTRALAVTKWKLSNSGSSPLFELTGTFWEQAEQLRVVALLMDSRTHEIAGKGEGVVNQDEVRKLGYRWTPDNYNEAVQISRMLGAPEQTSRDLNLELLTNRWTENPLFVEGDSIKIYVRINKPCVVRVFYHGGDGNIYVLTGDQDLTILPEEVNTIIEIYAAECTAPYGSEIVQGFATTGQFQPIRLTLLDSGLYGLDGRFENASIATREIKKRGGSGALMEKRVVLTSVSR